MKELKRKVLTMLLSISMVFVGTGLSLKHVSADLDMGIMAALTLDEAIAEALAMGEETKEYIRLVDDLPADQLVGFDFAIDFFADNTITILNGEPDSAEYETHLNTLGIRFADLRLGAHRYAYESLIEIDFDTILANVSDSDYLNDGSKTQLPLYLDDIKEHHLDDIFVLGVGSTDNDVLLSVIAIVKNIYEAYYKEIHVSLINSEITDYGDLVLGLIDSYVHDGLLSVSQGEALSDATNDLIDNGIARVLDMTDDYMQIREEELGLLKDMILEANKLIKKNDLNDLIDEILEDIESMENLSDLDKQEILANIDDILQDTLLLLDEATNIDEINTAYNSALDPLGIMWGEAKELNNSSGTEVEEPDVEKPDITDPDKETDGPEAENPDLEETLPDTGFTDINNYVSGMLIMLGLYLVFVGSRKEEV